MRDSVAVSVNSISFFAERKALRSLALLSKLRQVHRNGCFYNFSYRSLSAKTSIPVSTLRKHILVLRRLGFVSIHSGNLCLVKPKKALTANAVEDRIHNVEVWTGVSLSEMVKEMRLLILSRFNSQSYHKAKKQSGKSKGDVQKPRQACTDGHESLEYDLATADTFQISYLGIGKLLGLSKTGAFKFMREAGCFLKEQRVCRLGRQPSLLKHNVEVQGLFMRGGVVYKQLPNVYTWVY